MRDETASRLQLLRNDPAADEASLVRKLATSIKRVRTIDCDEAQRLFALYVRNGERWP